MKLELADSHMPSSTQFCIAEIAGKYIRVHTSLRGFLIAPLGPPSGVDLARNNLAVIITSRARRLRRI